VVSKCNGIRHPCVQKRCVNDVTLDTIYYLIRQAASWNLAVVFSLVSLYSAGFFFFLLFFFFKCSYYVRGPPFNSNKVALKVRKYVQCVHIRS